VIKTRSGYGNASEEFYSDFISTLSKLIMEKLRLGHSTCCACNTESVILSRETYTSLLYWLASCMRSFISVMSSSVSVLSVVLTVFCGFVAIWSPSTIRTTASYCIILSVNNVLGRCLWPFGWQMLAAHDMSFEFLPVTRVKFSIILRYSELIHCFKRKDYRCVCIILSGDWYNRMIFLP